MSAPKGTAAKAPDDEVKAEERTEVSSTDSRAVEEEEAAPWEPTPLGAHANPNGGEPVAEGDEPAPGPAAFGIAGESPEDGTQMAEEATEA
jgi:hypothetical protein